MEKATLPMRRSQTVWVLAHGPMRLIRSVAPRPTTLHYRRLTPNYRQSWQADSDAVNDLDSVEVERWFESRGDRCVNCGESSALDIQIGPAPSGVSHDGT